mmetsp:Transcript_7197/g.26218  ORF Transcript_7197/g.26218 Transcript_7197/m.26218 type:complete len:203 (-) Transcript_7197:17-625(-)
MFRAMVEGTRWWVRTLPSSCPDGAIVQLCPWANVLFVDSGFQKTEALREQRCFSYFGRAERGSPPCTQGVCVRSLRTQLENAGELDDSTPREEQNLRMFEIVSIASQSATMYMRGLQFGKIHVELTAPSRQPKMASHWHGIARCKTCRASPRQADIVFLCLARSDSCARPFLGEIIRLWAVSSPALQPEKTFANEHWSHRCS